jgi:hypothetical protein
VSICEICGFIAFVLETGNSCGHDGEYRLSTISGVTTMFRRFAVCAGLVAFSTLIVAQWSEPRLARAADKKEMALEKQIADLKSQLAQAAKDNATLKQSVTDLQTANTTGAAALKKSMTDATTNAKTLQSTIDNYRNAGLVHVVILTVKSDSPDGETQSLIDDANAQLAKIKGVRGLWAGKPSSSGISTASTNYTVALVLAFDDATALKNYFTDAVHTKFVDKHMKLWQTPLVFDFEPSKPQPQP